MRKKLSDIVVDFQQTGNCKVDVDLVCKLWNHTWLISQWKDEFTLCKYLRMGTGSMQIKVRISNEQATELSDRLKLSREQSPVFASGGTWRQSEIYWQKHREFITKKNLTKNKES